MKLDYLGDSFKWEEKESMIMIKTIYIEMESGSTNKLRSFLQATLNNQQRKIFLAHLTSIPSDTYPTKQQQNKLQKYTPVQANLIANLHEMEIEIRAFKKIKTSDKKEKIKVYQW